MTDKQRFAVQRVRKLAFMFYRKIRLWAAAYETIIGYLRVCERLHKNIVAF